jgi:m7GpppX diphosphatase
VRALGHNSIYHWYLGSTGPGATDVKLNLTYPCTEKHVRKYSEQGQRVVRETGEMWARVVEGWVAARREAEWVRNVIEGNEEQDDVVYREDGDDDGGDEGFVLLPDLCVAPSFLSFPAPPRPAPVLTPQRRNWDRETPHTLHLLALPTRADLRSIRDLRRKHIPWLVHMRAKILAAATGLYPGSLDDDQLKLYFHCACLPNPPPTPF